MLHPDESLSLDDEVPFFDPEPVAGEGGGGENEGERLALAVRLLRQVHEGLGAAISLLEGAGGGEAGAGHVAGLVAARHALARASERTSRTRVIEGVFDGMAMVGQDGRTYPVPPNYASKSRLVEGDVLKLAIRSDGTCVFKQIGPVERRRLVGRVQIDSSTGADIVVSGSSTYKVLPATVSFYKAQPGDEAVVLVPKSRPAVWAAVERVSRG